MQDKWLDTDAVAERLSLTPFAVLQLAMTDDQFPPHSVHEGVPSWTPEQIEAWQHPQPSEPEPPPSPTREAVPGNYDLVGDLDTMSDLIINVYECEAGANSSVTWLFKVEPDEMSLDMLKVKLENERGTGRYKVQVREHGKIKRSRIIVIYE